MKNLLLWPVRLIPHLLANLTLPDDLHFLLCGCPKSQPPAWMPHLHHPES